MRKISILSFLLFINHFSFSQGNIKDSLNNVLSNELLDTIKIDKINFYITRYSSNDPAVALIFSDSAIALSSAIQDSFRMAHSISRKGIALYFLGDYNASLENYIQAIIIKEKIKKPETIWREYNNIGLVLRNLDQNEEALKYYGLAMDLLKNNDDKSQLGILWNNIGICHNGLKQYDAAEEALEKALKINTEIGADQAIAFNLNNLGTIYFNRKNYQKAIELFEKALELNKSLYNRYEQVQCMNNLTEVHIKIEDYSKAKEYLVEVSEIFKNYKADQLKMNHLMIFGDYFVNIKDYKNALVYRNNYISLKDSLFDSNRFKQFDQLKMLANAEKEIQKIEFLNQINTMQNEKIRIQKIFLIIGVISILIILVLLFITLKDLKIRKKLNISLVERAYEIETLNEELKSTNEELHAQRDNLESALTNLQNTQQQLVQAEKMASLGVLASGVAHEINNPLNYINGGLMGLKDYLKNPKENESNIDFCIDAISQGVEKASIIVSGLNFFSRNKDLITENIDMNKIMNTCLMMLNSEISNRIEIVKNFTDEKYNLTGNEGKLHQVIMNILLNSVHAIEKKGEIIISTKVLEDNYLITISDTGSGIKEESISKIFDPFYTTKEPGKGTGLGLSIVYNIIQEHNGTIEINSTLNNGTIVRIKLPLVLSSLE